jgi:DNA-binding transcriptional ArsR family regulator
MSLPAVLQHLAALETSGLIRSEKKGRVRTCRLQPGVLSTAEQWLVDRRSEWEKRHDRFEEYVMELKDEEKKDDRQA